MSAHTTAEVWERVDGELLESARQSLAGVWPADPQERAVAVYGTLALRLGLVGSLAEWRRVFAAHQARVEQAEERTP